MAEEDRNQESPGLIERARENVADAEDIVSGVVAPPPGDEGVIAGARRAAAGTVGSRGRGDPS